MTLTLCQIHVTISKSAQQKMRLKQQTKELEVLYRAKQPDAARELASHSLPWRAVAKEGIGAGSLQLGTLLVQLLLKIVVIVYKKNYLFERERERKRGGETFHSG